MKIFCIVHLRSFKTDMKNRSTFSLCFWLFFFLIKKTKLIKAVKTLFWSPSEMLDLGDDYQRALKIIGGKAGVHCGAEASPDSAETHPAASPPSQKTTRAPPSVMGQDIRIAWDIFLSPSPPTRPFRPCKAKQGTWVKSPRLPAYRRHAGAVCVKWQ